jgi:phasin
MAKKPSPPAGAPAATKGPSAKSVSANKPVIAKEAAPVSKAVPAAMPRVAQPVSAGLDSPASAKNTTALTPPLAPLSAPTPIPAAANAPTLTTAPPVAAAVLAPPMSQPDASVETPKFETPKVVAPQVEASKLETPKVESPKIEAPNVEAPKVEAADPEKPAPAVPPAPVGFAPLPAPVATPAPTPIPAAPEPKLQEPGFAFGTGYELAKPLAAMMPAPETIRQMAETGLKQVRDQYETVKDVAEGTTDALGDSFDAAAKGISAMQAQALESFRNSANATFDLFSAIVTARSLSEAVALQASHARRQIEALTEQNKSMLALAQRVANDINEPLTSAARQGTKRIA